MKVISYNLKEEEFIEEDVKVKKIMCTHNFEPASSDKTLHQNISGDKINKKIFVVVPEKFKKFILPNKSFSDISSNNVSTNSDKDIEEFNEYKKKLIDKLKEVYKKANNVNIQVHFVFRGKATKQISLKYLIEELGALNIETNKDFDIRDLFNNTKNIGTQTDGLGENNNMTNSTKSSNSGKNSGSSVSKLSEKFDGSSKSSASDQAPTTISTEPKDDISEYDDVSEYIPNDAVANTISPLDVSNSQRGTETGSFHTANSSKSGSSESSTLNSSDNPNNSYSIEAKEKVVEGLKEEIIAKKRENLAIDSDKNNNSKKTSKDIAKDIKELKKAIEGVRKEIEELKETSLKEKSKKVIFDFRAKKKAIKEEVLPDINYTATHKIVKRQYEIKKIEESIDKDKSTIATNNTKIEEINKGKTAAILKIPNINKSIDVLEKEILLGKDIIAELNNELKCKNKEYDQLAKNEIATYKAKSIDRIDAEINDLQKSLEKATERLNALSAKQNDIIDKSSDSDYDDLELKIEENMRTTKSEFTLLKRDLRKAEEKKTELLKEETIDPTKNNVEQEISKIKSEIDKLKHEEKTKIPVLNKMVKAKSIEFIKISNIDKKIVMIEKATKRLGTEIDKKLSSIKEINKKNISLTGYLGNINKVKKPRTNLDRTM